MDRGSTRCSWDGTPITHALDAGIASPYPHLNQVVVSRQPRTGPPEITFSANSCATIRKLRRRAGTGIWVAGGGLPAGSFFAEIDHLTLKINPVVLGDGIPLFGGMAYDPRQFKRTRFRAFDSGVVIAEYSRATPR